MSKLHSSSFKNINILVIGDAMLDRYFLGAIHRQSPEADVPVVDIDSIEDKLGGAANVALNIKKMNANVELICSLGNDEIGHSFLKKIKQNDIISTRILISTKRQTTLKGRIYNQQEYLLRLDQETVSDFSKNESEELLKNIKESIEKFKPDVAILQDYNKGLFTQKNISKIIALLQSHNIKIAVDPKKDNFLAFRNVDLFKPNLKEVSDALAIEINAKSKENLEAVCIKLQEKIQCKNCLLTLSEYGAAAFDENKKLTHFPAFKRNVVDVSGAGDTVISVAALFLALGYSLEKIAWHSNLAGGITIEQKGVIALDIDCFLEELSSIT